MQSVNAKNHASFAAMAFHNFVNYNARKIALQKLALLVQRHSTGNTTLFAFLFFSSTSTNASATVSWWERIFIYHSWSGILNPDPVRARAITALNDTVVADSSVGWSCGML
uniref:Uncharacterized protein n=1 Tax=Anopheles culicifacies TaxID=139723 RepID=A0A182MIT2_9DIPT